MAVNIFKFQFLNHKVNYSMVFMVAVYEYNISASQKNCGKFSLIFILLTKTIAQ